MEVGSPTGRSYHLSAAPSPTTSTSPSSATATRTTSSAPRTSTHPPPPTSSKASSPETTPPPPPPPSCATRPSPHHAWPQPPPDTSTPSTSPPRTTSARAPSRRSRRPRQTLVPGIDEDPAWPTLRSHLILLAATGTDPQAALQHAVAARELDTAGDRAAVLDWRLDDTALRHAGPGPLPWLPAIPGALVDHPDLGRLPVRPRDARRRPRVRRPCTQRRATARTWLQPGQRTPDRQVLADLAVWRAATAVPDTDRRPTGPRQTLQGSRPLAARPRGAAHLDPLAGPRRMVATPRRPRPRAQPRPRHDAAGRPARRDLQRRPRRPSPAALAPSPRATFPTTTPPPRCGGGSAATSPPPSPLRADDQHTSPPNWADQLTAAPRGTTAPTTCRPAPGGRPWSPPSTTPWPAATGSTPSLDMAGPSTQRVDLDECQALVWRLSVLTEPQPDPDARIDLYPDEAEPPEDTDAVAARPDDGATRGGTYTGAVGRAHSAPRPRAMPAPRR